MLATQLGDQVFTRCYTLLVLIYSVIACLYGRLTDIWFYVSVCICRWLCWWDKWQFYVDTVKQMALRQLVAGSPLRTLCLLIAGQPADVFSTETITASGHPGAMSQQPIQVAYYVMYLFTIYHVKYSLRFFINCRFGAKQFFLTSVIFKF